MPSDLQVDNIKDGSATKTLATLSSSAVTLHSDVTFPAGHVISTQMFVGTGSNTTASWATSASYQTTGLTTGAISHGSGNKVLLTGRFLVNANGGGYDIYNSLEMGAAGLVLAGETAIGNHPKDAVIFLQKMIKVFKKKNNKIS